MDNRRLIFQTIFLLMIVTTSDTLFFQHPKHGFTDFLRSIKEKKEKFIKKSHEDIHHYHLHYYPVPVDVFHKPIKAPDTDELEHLHRKELKSLGWTDQEYKHGPEPEFIIPESLRPHDVGPILVDDPWPRHIPHEPIIDDHLTLQDQLDIAAVRQEIEHHPGHGYHKEKIVHVPIKSPAPENHHKTHISLHLPIHQKIVIHQPRVVQKEEKKVHPLIAFFQKLHQIKNSLFNFYGSTNNNDKNIYYIPCDDRMDKSYSPTSITSKIKSSKTYATLYFRPNKF